jgi:maltose alpha-D-glucosyltransferase / alpha-amylase
VTAPLGLRTAEEVGAAPAAAGVAVGRAGAAPRWYQDAVLYEVHVRAYQDSNADGVGDFRGLTQRLDHIRDLGVTALWLLPFYPSPLRDDGYDIAQYKGVHPAYGTLRDFRLLLREAHRRGLRVITELVMNHTSDEHVWFRRARRSRSGSVWRDFYVWSDTPTRYADARIIFKDFESSNWAWDPVAGAYFWHRFYSHQPDLNFDNPAVREAMFKVVDFWLELGVDGLRLDAVPYLFEREGTNSENLPETLDYLSALRRHVDERFHDRMLLAEANQWPEDAVAYFGRGDRCHMAFHFPLMPRMFMANRMEDRFPVVDILGQTPRIPENTQWATFLRNHDELTLEMVTDEERDYMYRVYAEEPEARINLGIRRRLGPLLGNDRRRIELLNLLLFSLPGAPVVYYGDEIGMGDNIYLGDRNGVRTPMQWTADRNAGFSQANPQRLYLPVIADPEYQPGAINVEAQQNNRSSLLWWMRHLIQVRRANPVLATGDVEFLFPDNRKVLVFLRTVGEERVLVVANLARSAQFVELDLSAFAGMVPVELFGPTPFPRIGELPYFLTLGPYGCYWFALTRDDDASEPAPRIPTISVRGDWTTLLERRRRRQLEAALPAFLARQRWFGAKGKRITGAEISNTVPLGGPFDGPPDGSTNGRSADAGGGAGALTFVTVSYAEGEAEVYALPIAARAADGDGWPPPENAVIAEVEAADGRWLLIDGVWEGSVVQSLLAMFDRRPPRSSGLDVERTTAFRRIRGSREPLTPQVVSAEQSNTSVAFGDRLILKLIRRLESGRNPDLEIGRFLTERAGFTNVAPVAGAISARGVAREPGTVAIVHGFVPNEGDAWSYALDALGDYYEQVLASATRDAAPTPPSPLAAIPPEPPSDEARDLVGTFLLNAEMLGQRVAELHLALASDTSDPAFAPESFTTMYQRSLYQAIRSLAARMLRRLRTRFPDVPGADELLGRERAVFERLDSLLRAGRIGGMRIRTHGDFHLGQVLWTGSDFVMIDFEGEPARSLGERRIKRSPLADVAGMLRSLDYAAEQALRAPSTAMLVPDDPRRVLGDWGRAWRRWTSAAFLGRYLDVAAAGQLVPDDPDDARRLLEALVLEKAVYELGYEIDNRPEWIGTPVRGILELLGDEA